MKKTAPTTSKEFDRFRELTRKLIQVPKSEVDEKQKQYERQKKQSNGKARRRSDR